jgi:hypothetical protein
MSYTILDNIYNKSFYITDHAMQEKHKEYIDKKDRQVEEEKLRQQAKEEEAKGLEEEVTHNNASSNNMNKHKHKPSKLEESSQKRVWIQEPHEATTETKPVTSSSNKKKKKPSLASIVKPKTTKKATSPGKTTTQLKTKSSKAKAKTPPMKTPKSNHKQGETKSSTLDTNLTPPKRGRPRSFPRQQHQQNSGGDASLRHFALGEAWAWGHTLWLLQTRVNGHWPRYFPKNKKLRYSCFYY